MRRTASIQSYNKKSSLERVYGISKLPDILPYPKLIPFDQNCAVKDIFCYIIKHYGTNGISVLIHRRDDDVAVQYADWRGNLIDITDQQNEYAILCSGFCNNDMVKILQAMRLIGVPQAQFFFATGADCLILCDVQTALNKMVGPGMIRDVFANIVQTQQVIKTEIIDDRAIEAIHAGNGSYEGDLIIKPSRFRLNHETKENSYSPLYAEMVR